MCKSITQEFRPTTDLSYWKTAAHTEGFQAILSAERLIQRFRPVRIVNSLADFPARAQLPPNSPGAYDFREDIVWAERDRILSPTMYYKVLFHEIIHWTGHRKRLNRATLGSYSWDPVGYAREEIIAELGAQFLLQEAGLPMAEWTTSARYIAGYAAWSFGESQEVVKKAGKEACTAAEYVLQIGR